MQVTILLSLLVGLFAKSSLAQQYAGASYNNSMPSVPGSEITFWNIQNPSGQNSSLLNYMMAPNGQQQDPSQVQRAVIVIHGLNRDPETYISNMMSALSIANEDYPYVNTSSVAIVAPYFANGDDKNVGYPWGLNTTSGLNASLSMATVWKSSRWANGDGNVYPSSVRGVSSYAVIDQMIEYFDNPSIYPNMKQIVIAGHSLGAQFANRYASVGNTLDTTAAVTYWVGNPDTWLWFNSSRPMPTQACSIYDSWRNGMSNYNVTYGAALASSPASVLSTWNGRTVTWARGLDDFGDDSSDCAAFTTGANRAERFFNSLVWFPPSSKMNVDYVSNVGHDAGEMFSSTAGYTRLFLDNWDGDGSRHLDFGPRQQAGDSPDPDSSNTPAPTINGTGAAGMTYHGCWSDAASSRALSYSAYQGNSNASIELCTAACAAANYTVAGMEYANQCFCDNSLAASSQLVGDAVCSMACAGNSTEMCGAASRMSVWSASTITKYVLPSTVASAGNFTSMGCYTDSQTSRTLATRSTASSNMTIQNCATFCSGYQYMGTEYSDECYCSNTIGAAAVAATSSDCDMTCSGNKLQYCGAGNRLSMYNNTGTAATTTTSSSVVPSITSTSTSPTSTTSTLTTSSSSTSSSIGTTSKTTSSTTSSKSSSSSSTKTSTSTSSSKTTSTTKSTSFVTSKSTTSSSAKATHTLLTVTKTGRWSFQNCIEDSSTNHILSTKFSIKSITPETCLAACLAKSYYYCGMESSSLCYGASKAPKVTIAPATSSGSTPVGRGCSMPCSGNSSVACGGTNRLNYYTYLGKSAKNVSPAQVE